MMDIHKIMQWFALHYEDIVAFWAALAILGQAVGRAIPDDATGILGVIRKAGKVLGLYVKNKETSDDSSEDTLDLDDRFSEIDEIAEIVKAAQPVRDAFKLGRDAPGKFVKRAV